MTNNLAFRSVVICFSLILLWKLLIYLFHLPSYILPSPTAVFQQFTHYYAVILKQSKPTIIEACLGFIFGGLMGVIAAVHIAYFKPARLWFLPILLVSQALPTFVIAPLFVMWFGYGEISKIATCMLMLFFPITSAFYDGLTNTPQGYIDLAQTMSASKWSILWRIRVPAALPHLASGLRVAATFAPMGAIVGEWVGASRGLGFLMLNANARMQIDVMFAVLITVILLTLLFYFVVDRLLKRLIDWQVV